MNLQTNHPPGSFQPLHCNPGQQEGALLSDHTDSHQHSSTQSTPQPLEDGLASTPGHSETSNDNNTAQENPVVGYGWTIHPVLGMVALTDKDGTVMQVYGPPLPQYFSENPDFPLLAEEGLLEMVPQPPYQCGNTQKNWDQKQSIFFFTREESGVNLADARGGKFGGINDRDSFPFNEDCRGITIRIHFPGYPSNTHVEKTLKDLNEDGREKAKSMQLSTKNYKSKPEPVTKSKLAQEVAKRIQWHIRDLETNSDLFPFDQSVCEKWRLGQGGMKFEHMSITALIHVSSGSWSPVIWIDKYPTGSTGGANSVA